MPEIVEPSFGKESFSCPHCKAHAHQTWYRLGMFEVGQGKKPMLYQFTPEAEQRAERIADDSERKNAVAFVKRLKENTLTYMRENYGRSDWAFVNFNVSSCYSCKAFAVWVEDKIVYPVSQSIIQPHEMMPVAVKADFEEAGSIVDLSPRGAAALARLCIQKLTVELGETGSNLNNDIAQLVKKGLEVEVQQALDVVRVIGNNAVHPGAIDLKDDKATALTLLTLVNMIVERRIAGPKKLMTMFAGLPPGARKQIEDRDGKGKPEGTGSD